MYLAVTFSHWVGLHVSGLVAVREAIGGNFGGSSWNSFKLPAMEESARDHVSAGIETASCSRLVSKSQNVVVRGGPNGRRSREENYGRFV